MSPESTLVDDLRVTAANTHEYHLWTAFHSTGDIETAVAEAELCREALRELAGKGFSRFTRELAREKLRSIPGSEELERLHKTRNSRA